LSDSQLRLFDPPPDAARGVAPAPCAPELAALAAGLPGGLRLGTSSWSFPGWAGIVYAERAPESRLAQQGLAAYARHPLLRTVGIDRTYYAPLRAEDFAAYAAQVGGDFRFLVKAPEAVVLAHYPDHPRHGALRGQPNPRFLDAAWACDQLIGPVQEGLGARAGPIVFQLPQQARTGLGSPDVFGARLHEFLASLPKGPRYSVELRDDALFGPEYAAALADTGVGHCVNVHPRMPSPRRQREVVPLAQGAPLVVRWMLGAGQRYEAARARFAPFDRIVDPDPDARAQVADLCVEALRAGGDATVVINNKAEGSAPLSVFALAQAIAQRA
jgi:uncharacterized protein YecE (DUF72 family)